MKDWFTRNNHKTWDELIIECLDYVNYRIKTPVDNQDTSKDNNIKLGDTVYIQRTIKNRRFKEKVGTAYKVVQVLDKNTVLLENNRVNSVRDLI